jgi:hypothetical protein
MPLGEKRNIMHEKSKGSILVYMDDDDYYPPTRVSHAVDRLRSKPEALCAGSSEIYIYFKHINKMYQFGPYGPNHATAGTFAFKRDLLKDHSYENNASLAEEKAFLKNYTVPFVQLDPLHSILVFSHAHNTFDKKRLLDNVQPNFVKESSKTVDMFIKDADMKDFFMNKIEDLLKNYEPGKPEMKPDVLKQIQEIEEMRKKQIEELQSQHKNNNQIVIQEGNNPPKALTIEQIVHILQDQKNQIGYLLNQIKGKDIEIEILTNQLNEQLNISNI